MFKCSLVHACRISCSLLYGCWRARVLLFVPKHFLLFNSLPVIAMTCCLLLVKIGENISMKSYCCPFRSATTQIVFSSTVTKGQHSWWVGWLDEPPSSSGNVCLFLLELFFFWKLNVILVKLGTLWPLVWKPGNVMDFDSCQGNVRDFSKSQGNVRKNILWGKSCLKLFIVSCIFASILDFAELVHFIFVSDHALLHCYPHHWQ